MSAGTKSLCHEYHQFEAHDTIVGTKDQLQALGLGVGLEYPVNEKQKLRTTDPRGHGVLIKKRSQGLFYAYVNFQNWPAPPDKANKLTPREPFAAGVLIDRSHCWCDKFTGTAEDLISAGLIREDQLPAKFRVTIPTDGGPNWQGSKCRSDKPGSLVISRASPTSKRYTVSITVSDDESARRRAASDAAEEAWKKAVRALPRPERLTDYVLRRITEQRTPKAPASSTLAGMGMLHRRKLPDGWRVIEGQRPA